MKITCLKSELLKCINISLKAVPVRSTMPILECILIDATSNEIKFISNDTEMGIETNVLGKIEEPGMLAIEAKIFSEIVRKLPDNNVTISSDANHNVTITCLKTKFSIAGDSGEDFAFLPDIQREGCITISQLSLRQIIAQTIFSISQGDNNILMSGELFEIKGDQLRVTALDGHRISIRRIGLRECYEDNKVIVPGKTLGEIAKILTGGHDDMVHIFITENHIIFELDETTVVSRLIEGEYFAVDQMISADYESKVTVNRNTFMDCIDRASLFVKEGDKKPIIMNFEENNCNLSIESPLGSLNEDIDIEMKGRGLMIGFNPRFMIDALKAIDDENITLYMTNAKSPCFMKDDEGTYTYLVLPVNFTR